MRSRLSEQFIASAAKRQADQHHAIQYGVTEDTIEMMSRSLFVGTVHYRQPVKRISLAAAGFVSLPLLIFIGAAAAIILRNTI